MVPAPTAAAGAPEGSALETLSSLASADAAASANNTPTAKGGLGSHVPGKPVPAVKPLPEEPPVSLSPIERLKFMYDRGGPVTRADVNDWWAGQCIKPQGGSFHSLILFSGIPDNPAGGPLFKNWRVGMRFATDGPPSYFDSLTDHLVAELRGYLNDASSSEVPVFGAESMSFTQTDTSYWLKKFGPYLVLKAKEQGDDYYYAYFYKKVTPKE